jgi:hypothetical protein
LLDILDSTRDNPDLKKKQGPYDPSAAPSFSMNSPDLNIEEDPTAKNALLQAAAPNSSELRAS